MNDEIRKKLELLILKALEGTTDSSIKRADKLINMRATVSHIENMEKK